MTEKCYSDVNDLYIYTYLILGKNLIANKL